MTHEEELALKEFLLDVNSLKRLDKWADDFNLFDVLKITNMEIRHSNILAWLFDPNENHGLGDSFIKEFFTMFVKKADLSRYDAFKLLLQDFDSYQVYRERNNMDIVLLSLTEKTAVIIENKVWSGESDHQLKDYIEKSKIYYKDCEQIVYVFLTPDGHEASDSENWIPFSYEEILMGLEISTQDKQLKPDVDLVIRNYKETVRRKIMKEKDEELVKICNEIYNKHRTALKLIFENVNIDNSAESEILYDVLRKFDGEGKIIFKNDNRWRFFTPKMDEYLPKLSMPNSSWHTDWVYYYWFEKNDDKLSIIFEIGGANLTEELRSKTNILIQKANKKQDEYTFKRLYRKTEKLNQNDYENSFRTAVEKLVNGALEMEKKLLS